VTEPTTHRVTLPQWRRDALLKGGAWLSVPLEPQPHISRNGDIIYKDHLVGSTLSERQGMDYPERRDVCPYAPGDVLAVGEEWRVLMTPGGERCVDYRGGGQRWVNGTDDPLFLLVTTLHKDVRDRCFIDCDDSEHQPYRPAKRIPKQFVRLRATVLAVEGPVRVRDMTAEDAEVEGCRTFESKHVQASARWIYHRQWEADHPTIPFDKAWAWRFEVEVTT
jgi:hypothetical protein